MSRSGRILPPSEPPRLSDLERVSRAEHHPTIGPVRAVLLGPVLLLALVLGVMAAMTSWTVPFADTIARVRGTAAESVSAVSHDPRNGDVYVGHPHDGITRIDSRTFHSEHFTVESTGGGLPGDNVLGVSVTDDGRLLVLADEPTRALAQRGADGHWRTLIEGGRVEGLDHESVVTGGAVGDLLFLLLRDGTVAVYDRVRRRLDSLRVVPAFERPVESFAVDRHGVPVFQVAGRLFMASRSDDEWRRTGIDLGRHESLEIRTIAGQLFVRTRDRALLVLDAAAAGYVEVVAGRTFPRLDLSAVAAMRLDVARGAVWLAQTSGAVGRYDTARGRWSWCESGAPSDAGLLAIAPDGTCAVVGLADGGIAVLRHRESGLERDGTLLAGRRAISFETSGRELIVVAGSEDQRIVWRGGWGSFERIDERVVTRVPMDKGSWIDTLALRQPPDDVDQLLFATRVGELRPYNLKWRTFDDGEVWTLGEPGPWRAVRGHEHGMFGVNDGGELFLFPLPRDAVRGEIGGRRLFEQAGPSADSAIRTFARFEDRLVVVLEDGPVHEYCRDRGWRRPEGIGDVRTVRRDAAGQLFARTESGGVWMRGEQGWRLLRSEAPVTHLGFGHDSIPARLERGGWVRLAHDVGRPPESVAWLPPPPDGGAGPRGNVVDLHAAGNRLIWADTGGIRAYDRDSRGWRALWTETGASDWHLHAGAEHVFAFSRRQGLAVELDPATGKIDRILRGVSAWAPSRTGVVVHRRDGSVTGLDTAFSGLEAAPKLLDYPTEAKAVASAGDVAYLLQQDGTLLLYDPRTGRVAPAPQPGARDVSLLAGAGGVAYAVANGREVFACSATAQRSIHKSLDERITGLVPVPAGVCLRMADGSIRLLDRRGSLRVLSGGESASAPAGIYGASQVRGGLWFGDGGRFAFWSNETRSIEAVEDWAARGERIEDLGVHGTRLLLRASDGLFELGQDSGKVEPIYRKPVRGWILGGEIPLVVDHDGALRSLARPANPIGFGAPTGVERFGRITRVVPDGKTAVLGTDAGFVAAYDPTARGLVEPTAVGSSVRRLEKFKDGVAVLGNDHSLRLWPDPQQGVLLRDVRDVAVDGAGRLIALKSDGSVHHVARGKVTERLPAGRATAKAPESLRRAVAVGDRLVCLDASGWSVYDSRTRRVEAEFTSDGRKDVYPLGADAVVAVGQKQSYLVNRRGAGPARALHALGPPILLGGDGEKLAIATAEGVHLALPGGAVRPVMQIGRAGPGRIRGAASGPNGSRLFVLGGDGRLWSYDPDAGDWERHSEWREFGDSARIVMGGKAPTGIWLSPEKMYDLMAGATTQSHAGYARAGGKVAWVDDGGRLRQIGSEEILWNPPLRCSAGQELAWSLSASAFDVLRLSEQSLIVTDARWHVLDAELPASAPVSVVDSDERLWAHVGDGIWRIDARSAQHAATSVEDFLGVSKGAPVYWTTAGELRRGRDEILVGPPNGSAPRGVAVAVAPEGSGVWFAADGTGTLHTRRVDRPRTEWLETETGLDRVASDGLRARGAGVEVHGKVGNDHAWEYREPGDTGASTVAVRLSPSRLRVRIGAIRRALPREAWKKTVGGRWEFDPGSRRWACFRSAGLSVFDPQTLGLRSIPGISEYKRDPQKNLLVRVEERWVPIARLVRSEAGGSEDQLVLRGRHAFVLGGGWPRPATPADMARLQAEKLEKGWRLYEPDRGFVQLRSENGIVVVDGAGSGSSGTGPPPALAPLLEALGGFAVDRIRICSEGVAIDTRKGVYLLGSDGPVPLDRAEAAALLGAGAARHSKIVGGCLAVERDIPNRHSSTTLFELLRLTECHHAVPHRSQAGSAADTVTRRGRTLSLQRGILLEHCISGLFVDRTGGRVAARFANGSSKVWTGTRWREIEAPALHRWEPPAWSLEGRFRGRSKHDLAASFGASWIRLRSAAGRRFDCDRIRAVMPASAGGVYLLAEGLLWLAERNTPRVPVRSADGALVSGSRLRLRGDARARRRPIVLVGDGARAWLVEGSKATPLRSGSTLLDHPAEGSRTWNGMHLDQPPGQGTVDVRLGDGSGARTRFIGSWFEHDSRDRLVLRDGRVYVRNDSHGAEHEPGAASFDVRANPPAATPVSDVVAVPESSFRFQRRDSHYVFQVRDESDGYADSGFLANRGRFAHDVLETPTGSREHWFHSSPLGVVREAYRDPRHPVVLGAPGDRTVTELRVDREDELWMRRESVVYRRTSNGWSASSVPSSPFAPVRRFVESLAADSPWTFESGEANQLRVRHRVLGAVRYLPSRGNFDVALLASGGAVQRNAAGDLCWRSEGGFVQLRAGTGSVRRMDEDKAFSPEGWTDLVGDTRVAVESSTASTGMQCRLVVRPSEGPPPPLSTVVRRSRIDHDRVLDLAALGSKGSVALATPCGVRIFPAGGGSGKERSFTPWPRTPVHGARALSADGSLMFRVTGRDGQTPAYYRWPESGTRLVAAHATAWSALEARVEERTGSTDDDGGIRWRREEGALVVRAGPSGLVLDYDPRGFLLDHPDDAILGRQSAWLRVGSHLFRLPVGADVGQVAERRSCRSIRYGVGGDDRSPGVFVELAVGEWRRVSPAGDLADEFSKVSEEPCSGLVAPWRLARRDESTCRLSWSDGTSGTLQDGGFLHDWIRDCAIRDGKLWLATRDGVVCRTTAGRWIAKSRDLEEVDRVLAMETGGIYARIDATGQPGRWVRIRRDGAAAGRLSSESLDSGTGARATVYEDRLIRVSRSGGGPVLSWRDAGRDAWTDVDRHVVEQGVLPWDWVDRIVRIPGETRGSLRWMAGRWSGRLDEGLRPSSGLRTVLPEGFQADRMIRLEEGLLLMGAESAVAIAGDGDASEITSEAAWKRASESRELGRWRFGGPGRTGVVRVSRAIQGGKVIPVRDVDGALEIDLALGMGGAGSWAAYLTSCGVAVMDWSGGSARGRRLLPMTPLGIPADDFGFGVSEDADVRFLGPNSQDLLVDKSGTSVRAVPSSKARPRVKQPIADWGTGRVIRAGGVLVYEDESANRTARGPGVFKNGRFAWDHGVVVVGDLYRSAHGIERVVRAGELRMADAADHTRLEQRILARRGAEADVSGARITVSPEGLSVDGARIGPSGGEIVYAHRFDDRLWIGTRSGLWFIRLETRWIERLREEGDTAWPGR